MGPCGNEQGGYKFMTLNKESKVTRHKWTELPMTESVIARVNFLGKDQPKDLTFLDRHGNPIGEIEIPGVDEQEESTADSTEEDDSDPPMPELVERELQQLDQLVPNADLLYVTFDFIGFFPFRGIFVPFLDFMVENSPP